MSSITFNQSQLEAAARFIFNNNKMCHIWPNPPASELDVLNQIVENGRHIARENATREPDNQITAIGTGGYTIVVDDINDQGNYTLSVLVDPAVSNNNHKYVSYEVEEPEDD